MNKLFDFRINALSIIRGVIILVILIYVQISSYGQHVIGDDLYELNAYPNFSYQDLEKAEILFSSTDTAKKQLALAIWEDYFIHDTTSIMTPQKKKIASEIAQYYANKGNTDLALVYLGRSLDDSMHIEVEELLLTYSDKILIDEIRGKEEIDFVRKMRTILKVLKGDVIEISDVNEAYKAAELLQYDRMATLIITTNIKNLEVEIKRLIYENNSHVLWRKIYPNDTIQVKAASYIVRYNNPDNQKDIRLLKIPCADGCEIRANL